MNKEVTDRALLEELATEFGLDLTSDIKQAVLDTAARIDESAGYLYHPDTEAPDSVGSYADDNYGALLEVYDEPRSESNDGPLAGNTVAVKDVLAVQLLQLTCGSRSLEFVPTFDATVVSRLLDAGASIVGKANCDAFALGPTGEFSELDDVINPVAPDHVPGGSSSGSGAAVAAGLVDVALGTDTGGSVRLPASCCGVVGVKPSHGLVSRYGLVELAPSTDTIGPLASDVTTAATALAAIAGPDPRDPATTHNHIRAIGDLDDHGNLRIGLPTSLLEPACNDIQGVVEDLVASLRQLNNVTVEPVEINLGDLGRVYSLIVATEYVWLLRQSMLTRGDGIRHGRGWPAALADTEFSDHVATRILPAALIDEQSNGQAYAAAREVVLEFKHELEAIFDTYDLLITPTMRVAPPKRGQLDPSEGMSSIVGNTAPFSATGHPAVSVPGGEVDSLPIGVQVIAPIFADRQALIGARLIERVADI